MAIPDCNTCPCRVGCFKCHLRNVKCPGVGDCGSMIVTLRPCPVDICALAGSGVPWEKWPKSAKVMFEEMCERWEEDVL